MRQLLMELLGYCAVAVCALIIEVALAFKQHQRTNRKGEFAGVVAFAGVALLAMVQ